MTEEQIHRTSLHEVGHFLACAHFRARAFPQVGVESETHYSPTSIIAGICSIPDPLTPYEACVIGWSGIMAQALTDTGYDWMPPFVPTQKTLRDWYSMALARLENFSDEDAKMIRGGQRKTWLACRSAFRILSHDKVRLKRIARCLANDAKKRNQPMTEINSETSAIAFRADALEQFLKGMKPDDPDLPRLKSCLEYLRHGVYPPDEVVGSFTETI